MRTIAATFFTLTDFLREILILAKLLIPELGRGKQKPEIPVIASMTTYPPRMKWAWVSIETLLRQTVRPQKLLLVLNLEEFPDQKLPLMIRSQTRRGLEILWVEKNGGSYDKLLPVRREYPHATIVTFDDDKYFPLTLLSSLYDASRSNPGVVIGSRGWEMHPENGDLHYGAGWSRAVAGAKSTLLLCPGGNGCLYPPDSFSTNFDDLELAKELCPTADDIWFWFAVQASGASTYCLGLSPHRQVRMQNGTPALSEVNTVRNDEQFQAMKLRFGLPLTGLQKSE